MINSQTATETHLPSFSVILETENLANVDLNELFESLASFAQQDLSPTCANEVLLIESGDTPAFVLEQLQTKYPWITVHWANSGIDYHEAKMLGASLATGEIVVYCDSDCIYEVGWLRSLVNSFSNAPEVKVVAGETITRGEGFYGLAMGVTYLFPRYSHRQKLSKGSHYYLNNVAFRREFLLQHPIPTELPIYRGNCSVHAAMLCKQGYTVWQQPQARATHAPPEGLSFFFWRFLLMGHDRLLQERLISEINDFTATTHSSGSLHQGRDSRVRIWLRQLKKILTEKPYRVVQLPLAMPVLLASVLLMLIGEIVTVFSPDYLLRIYLRSQGEPPSSNSTLPAMTSQGVTTL